MTIQHADTPQYTDFEANRFAKGDKLVISTGETLDEAQAGEEWIQCHASKVMEVEQ